MFRGEIINSDKYNEARPYRNIIAIVFTICIFLIIRRHSRNNILDSLGLTQYEPYIFFIAIITGVILVFSFYGVKSKQKGEIIIDNDNIKISNTNQQYSYSINSIVNINITHSTYISKAGKQTESYHYRGNNYISFDVDSRNYRYEFTIDSYFMNNQLLKAIAL